MPMKDCIIIFRDEVFEIEKAGTQLNTNDPETASLSPVKRKYEVYSAFVYPNPDSLDRESYVLTTKPPCPTLDIVLCWFIKSLLLPYLSQTILHQLTQNQSF